MDFIYKTKAFFVLALLFLGAFFLFFQGSSLGSENSDSPLQRAALLDSGERIEPVSLQ